jgi:sterol 3beta-glucosyltransferase
VAFVKSVIPLDPKKPRIIKLVTESALKSVVEYTEFDTEESAHDWRRELIGTVLTFY